MTPEPSSNADRLVFSIDELAAACGCSRTHILDQVREQCLIARKSGRRTVFLRDDVDAWLASLPAAQISPRTDKQRELRAEAET
jgi:excisionase family DNA binding protein